MNDLTIQVDSDRAAFEPCEVISVLAEWMLQAEPESIELRMVWNTAGKGYMDFRVEGIIPLDSPGLNGSRRIDFKLPNSPYSFTGTLFSLVWALELVALPSNASCRTEITIAPGTRAVNLRAT